MAFVVDTHCLLSSWSRAVGGSWQPAGAEALSFQLGRAVRAMRSCFDLLVRHGFLPDLRLVAVQSLGRLGFKRNSGRACGLSSRPDFSSNDVVCISLRAMFHVDTRNRLSIVRVLPARVR